MPKPKTSFLCSACGDDFPKWFGKCPTCGEWGNLSEFKVLNKRYDKSKPQNDLNNLNQVLSRDIEERVETKLNEIDRVLGGGVLQGVNDPTWRQSWSWKINFISSSMFISKNKNFVRICRRK